MPPIEPETKKYKVRVAIFSRMWLDFVQGINVLLVFLSLRKKRKYWGIVYDSVTKQPLDPVIVKLAYLQGDVTKTCVTDLSGNYGFLAHPGKFKLLAKKSNYVFPSKIVAGDRDGIYDNLYHGEFFELNNDYEVVGPNIPMDPVNFDWNQQAKQSMMQSHPFRQYLVKRLVTIFFWFGFALNLLYLAGHLSRRPVFTYYIAAAYGFLLLLTFITPEIRLWGKIKENVFTKGMFLLELHNPQLQGISFGKTEIEPGGKFLLRANKGSYNLVIKHQDFGEAPQIVGEAKVTVGSEGVVNETLVIK